MLNAARLANGGSEANPTPGDARPTEALAALRHRTMARGRLPTDDGRATPMMTTKAVAESSALLIDAPTLAALLSVSEATLYRMLAGGKIPAPLRLSRGCVRWHRETVERWLATSEANGRLIDRASWETLCANTNGKPR